jgi:hypothetical protein
MSTDLFGMSRNTSISFSLLAALRLTETYFHTGIFMPRQFTDSSYSHPSEYSPPSDIILLSTLFQNLPTTLSDIDIFMTKISAPPENSTTFYVPYYSPSAKDAQFKESRKVSRLTDKDSRYSEFFQDRPRY